MRKYSVLFILIVGILIFFIVFEEEDTTKKLVSNEDNIIGIWKTNKCEKSSKIDEAAIQFNEDGSCVFVAVFSVDESTAQIEQRNEGHCYLNSSKTKLEMEEKGNIVINWEKYNNNGNSIVIGDCEYSKVS